MSTPPPVLPPPDSKPSQYRTTWLDRVGPEGGIALRAMSWSARAGITAFAALELYAAQSGMRAAASMVPIALVIGIVFGTAVYFISMKLLDGVGVATRAFTMPSGKSTPYEQTFSYQESLAVRGDVAGALESYEAVIAENPFAIPPRLKAAEHYAKGNRNPARAAELFREIREIPGCNARDAVYASSRLADLYDGPLEDPGRALVELRRIIEQYPTSRMAAHARTALPALKARLHPRTAD
jgi:hypothetical protein